MTGRSALTSKSATSRGEAAYPHDVTKRLIDVDEAKLAAVQTALGTETLADTVDAAFEEVLQLVERRRTLLADRGVDYSDLADKAKRQALWRR
jgi:Arc/MetJ family transcription regulator